MYGAILGDMIGAPFEFDRGGKTKEFPLFGKDSVFTDDSVMTIAVAEALMAWDEKDVSGPSVLSDTPNASAAERVRVSGAEREDASAAEREDVPGTKREEASDAVKDLLIRSMHVWGLRYPGAGYGGMFALWLLDKDPKPYNSFGNGSAMRVSSVGWLYGTMEQTRKMARLTAEVTHNHPEGIKGAESTAAAIWLARQGVSKDEIRAYITAEFGYDLSRTCDEIRPAYRHVETCQETVPEAITAFLEGENFEDVIRTAVSLGGDCDTLTCIAGGIAEAYYGVPEPLIRECRSRLPQDMLAVLDRFDSRRGMTGTGRDTL